MTRWDIVATPPDILVTNYSMLNAMLMRDIEDRLFSQTAAWLRSDPSNVFTLVVDELHLYRGTSGAEVAMVIRNLTSRLGLQSRLAAASRDRHQRFAGGRRGWPTLRRDVLWRRLEHRPHRAWYPKDATFHSRPVRR